MKKVRLNLDIAAETAARLRTRFPRRGQITAYLRQVVERAAASEAPAPTAEAQPALPESGERAVHFSLRLYPQQIALIEREAKRFGLRPAQWLRALIDHRSTGTLTLPEADRLALLAATDEVRRIGVNLNMLVRDVKRAIAKGRPVQVDEKLLSDLAAQFTLVKAETDRVVANRQRYWSER